MQAAFSLLVVDRVVAALTMATHLGDIRITLETNLTSDLKLGRGSESAISRLHSRAESAGL